MCQQVTEGFPPRVKAQLNFNKPWLWYLLFMYERVPWLNYAFLASQYLWWVTNYWNRYINTMKPSLQWNDNSSCIGWRPAIYSLLFDRLIRFLSWLDMIAIFDHTINGWVTDWQPFKIFTLLCLVFTTTIEISPIGDTRFQHSPQYTHTAVMTCGEGSVCPSEVSAPLMAFHIQTAAPEQSICIDTLFTNTIKFRLRLTVAKCGS